MTAPADREGLIEVMVRAYQGYWGYKMPRAGDAMFDILTAIEGDAVRDTEELQAALEPERVGTAVRLSVLRGGEPQELSATPAERA